MNIRLVGQDKPTQREQIEKVLEFAKARNEPLRIRIPFSLYDMEAGRGYLFIKDASWNLQLPSNQTTPEHIEHLIRAIGECITAIAKEGTGNVLKRLRESEKHWTEESEDLTHLK